MYVGEPLGDCLKLANSKFRNIDARLELRVSILTLGRPKIDRLLQQARRLRRIFGVSLLSTMEVDKSSATQAISACGEFSGEARRRSIVTPLGICRDQSRPWNISIFRAGRVGDAAAAICFGAIALLLLLRLTCGADLGDEGYYAIFLDDWLKGGISTSAFLSIHQTAALIVYPVARLYFGLTGSRDGLFLLLRVVFLLGAVASAAFWIIFLKRLGYRLMAWAGGCIVLSFVPFGLPAPSYNTLGQQALVTALACLGCANLWDAEGRRQVIWLAGSAAAWAAATVAYPPLILPCLCSCVIGLHYRADTFVRPRLYTVLVGLMVCSSWIVVTCILSPDRLYQGLLYSQGIGGSDWTRKFQFVGEIFGSNVPFSLLFAASIVVGLTSNNLPNLARLSFAAILLCLFATTPALYVRSHDAVTLTALMGIGLLGDLRRSANRRDRIVACIYLISLVAALTTSATAYMSIYNFSIGAIPAAALACIGRTAPKPSSIIRGLPAAATIFVVLATSLFFYYGEVPAKTSSREFMTGGFFAGLRLHPEDAAVIRLMEGTVDNLLPQNQNLVVLGRLPGLVLATGARLKMPSAFALPPSVSPQGVSAAGEYYERAGHRPTAVLIYRDAFFTAANPIPQFETRYHSTAKFKTPIGELELFLEAARQ